MKKIVIIMAVAAIFSGCQNEKKNFIESVDNKVRVEVIQLDTSRAVRVFSYSGTVEASKTIPLSFKSIGTIESVYVDEGDYVEAGQLLAELEKGSLVSAYNSAKAQYEQAIDAQKRLKQVHDNNSLPEIKWVEVNSKVTQAKSMLEMSEKNLENCKLRAPVDGFIAERNIEEGMSSVALAPPFSLVNIESVLIKISVPENEISLLKKGQESIAKVSALNDKEFVGIIDRVGVVANRISRTYDVKIMVDNSKLLLKPGMVCELDVHLKPMDAEILIPMKAVSLDEEGKTYVFVVIDNTSIKKVLKINGIVNDKISVASGLKAGDLIVVKGMQKLVNGSKVEY